MDAEVRERVVPACVRSAAGVTSYQAVRRCGWDRAHIRGTVESGADRPVRLRDAEE